MRRQIVQERGYDSLGFPNSAGVASTQDLELEVQGELNLPGARTSEGLQESELRPSSHAEYRIDPCDVRMIQEVEGFRYQIETRGFTNREVF